MELNIHIANAICTITAVGFIEANKDTYTLKEISKNADKTTSFVYQKKDLAEHTALKKLLECYNISIAFKNENEKCVPPMTDEQRKYIMPLIVAKSRTVYDDKVMEEIADDFRKALLNIESSVNMERLRRLPGAYIGGLANLSDIRFSGPSYLFLYTPTYRNDIGASVRTSYENAAGVTGDLVDFLKRKCGPPKTTSRDLHFDPAYSGRYRAGEYVAGKLFASCHGMVMAIYDFLDTADKSICVELSLGADTCKVASCLPCSIFMTANEVPASSTHLGRGDNWHYPETAAAHRRTRSWAETLYKSYLYGLKKLGDGSDDFRDEDNLLAAIGFVEEKGIGSIPQIFLESLTYESPFTEKITRTLKRRPPA